MLDLELYINRIQDKIQQLTRSKQLLARENQRLEKELEKARALLAEKDGQLQNIQQQLDALQLGTTSSRSPEEKAELEKRINGYLKEIDRCLALLNTGTNG